MKREILKALLDSSIEELKAFEEVAYALRYKKQQIAAKEMQDMLNTIAKEA